MSLWKRGEQILTLSNDPTPDEVRAAFKDAPILSVVITATTIVIMLKDFSTAEFVRCDT